MSVRKVTVATLAGLKARNEKAVFVTAPTTIPRPRSPTGLALT